MPRLAEISKMMQPVARSAFCAESRALAAGLMRLCSSAKPTHCFCGGRGRGLSLWTWRCPKI